jgi:diguanylate cyclase (GGDEF)-like protein/PAS domain S-box-containing protein
VIDKTDQYRNLTGDREHSIPTRITVIVFWGMLFIGVISAYFLINNMRNQTIGEYVHIVDRVSDRIADSIHADKIVADALLIQLLEHHGKDYLLGISVHQSGRNPIQHGSVSTEAAVFTRYLRSSSSENNETVSQTLVKTYFLSVDQVILNERKTVLLLIGLVLVGFGAFMRWALSTVLAKPFDEMVQTASKISDGEIELRFDESLTGEFGYMAKFINVSLDHVVREKGDIASALARANEKVSESEVELRFERERAEVTLHSISDAVITTDQKARVLYANPSALRMLGMTAASVNGKSVADIMIIADELTGKKIEHPVRQCLKSGSGTGLFDYLILRRPDGMTFDIAASVARIKQDRRGLIGAVMVFHDASHARKLNRQLSYQATHDELTGLFNRREFDRQLEIGLHLVRIKSAEHVLFYMDMDQFKIVNDTCGHYAGDELLKQVATLIKDKLRDSDVLSRLGGDEFGALLTHCGIDHAMTVAKSIVDSMASYRFGWQDKSFSVGLSIGVVPINPGSVDIDAVLEMGDAACYKAKSAGMNQIHLYSPEDTDHQHRNAAYDWSARLMEESERDRLCLFQQPVFGVQSGEIEHHEILLRYREQDDKIIMPAALISAAERYRMMSDIDQRVIARAISFLANGDCAIDIKLSINLSTQSINSDMRQFIENEVAKSNIDPSRIVFELTEVSVISGLAEAESFIGVLHRQGFRFAIDDFGTGLSSFSYLRRLQVDYVKIDGQFIRNVDADEVDRAMVSSIVQVCRALDIKTIAEYVESSAVAQVVRDIGIDAVQGYWISKPEPLEQLQQHSENDDNPLLVSSQ